MEKTNPTKKDKDFFSKLTKRILFWGIIGVFVIAPFYAPISVWLASYLQHFDLLRIWKEVALTAMSLVLLFFLLKNRHLAGVALKDKLFILIVIYALVIICRAAYDLLTDGVHQDAVIYGLLINLRFMAFFGLIFLAGKTGQLGKYLPWRKFILIPAAAVVIFGLLQFSVLPKDVLSHVGYSKATIVPYQTVDNNPDFVRTQSTLRGPNPLGAYLVLIITLITVILISRKTTEKPYMWMIFGVAALVVLFSTYSRSAWVGTAISLSVLFVVSKKHYMKTKYIVLAMLVLVFMAASGLLLRQNYTIQNILFHTSDRSSAPTSSNAERTSALKIGAQDIIDRPLGSGVGSAGPASLRNKKGHGRIPENYFLQIGQEVGVVGLLVFVAINIILLVRLYRSNKPLQNALFASMVGLIFVNMVSHAWTDDTLSLLWWGLAGIALSSLAQNSVGTAGKD